MACMGVSQVPLAPPARNFERLPLILGLEWLVFFAAARTGVTQAPLPHALGLSQHEYKHFKTQSVSVLHETSVTVSFLTPLSRGFFLQTKPDIFEFSLVYGFR